MKDIRRTWPNNLRAHIGSRTEVARTGPAGSCPRSSANVMIGSLVFCGTPNRGTRYISYSFACSLNSFLPIALPVQP